MPGKLAPNPLAADGAPLARVDPSARRAPLAGIDVRDRDAVLDRLDRLVIGGQLDVDQAAELAFTAGWLGAALGGVSNSRSALKFERGGL